MKQEKLCLCGNAVERYDLCNECRQLLKVKKYKSVAAVEAMRNEYNASHDRYMTYGQFVAYIEAIYRRKKNFDNTRKKVTSKEVRSTRRKNRAIAS